MKQKSLKKILAAFLTFAIVVGTVSAGAVDESRSVDFIMHSDSHASIAVRELEREADFSVAYVTRDRRGNLTAPDVLNEDVVVVDFADIEAISDTARGMVDSGTMLYITNPEVSAEELAVMLAIPRSSVTSYNELLLIAFSVYKVNGVYVFENHYVLFTDCDDFFTSVENEAKCESDFVEKELPIIGETNFDNVTTVREYKEYHGIDSLSISLTDSVLTAYDTMQRTLNEASAIVQPGDMFTTNSTWPTSSADEFFNVILHVYSGSSRVGFVRGTTRVYLANRRNVNGASSGVWSVVTRAEAFPNSNVSVTEYRVRISAFIQGHDFLETVNLPSGGNTTASITLSKTPGVNLGWSFNPDNQRITRSSPNANPRLVEWTARPSNPLFNAGRSYDITPGATLFATPGHPGQRGAFATLFCNNNSVQFGGWL
jgi:hypothetical protein